MTARPITEQIKQRAREIGFDLVGITSAAPHEHVSFLDQWLAKGYDGTMAYLARRRDERAAPQQLLPGAKTMICCGLNYHGGEASSSDSLTPEQGWISRYAWGEDYHEVVLAKLKQLESFIHETIDPTAQLKSYVDTGPILERSYAASAGLGWIAKNTMLINRRQGSYFFIGEIITDMELSCDAPETDHCGNCRLCIEACPTEALAPYEMDASRCISYLTIEQRGEIAVELQQQMGQHLVGCDICQEVCPWNHEVPISGETAFRPREGLHRPKLEAFDAMTEDGFRERFRNSAIKRVKWKGLQRNVTIAKRNAKSGAG